MQLIITIITIIDLTVSMLKTVYKFVKLSLNTAKLVQVPSIHMCMCTFKYTSYNIDVCHVHTVRPAVYCGPTKSVRLSICPYFPGQFK